MRVKEANVKSTSMGEPNLRFRNQLSFLHATFQLVFFYGCDCRHIERSLEALLVEFHEFLNSCTTFKK